MLTPLKPCQIPVKEIAVDEFDGKINNETENVSIIDGGSANISIHDTEHRNISIIDVDELPDDDVLEYIDLTSPNKSIPENAPMPHKKKLLKQFLAEDNAVIFSVDCGADGNKESESSNDASALHLLDGKND